MDATTPAPLTDRLGRYVEYIGDDGSAPYFQVRTSRKSESVALEILLSMDFTISGRITVADARALGMALTDAADVAEGRRG